MRWVLIGGVAIVAFDIVSALAAAPLGFEYGSDPVGLALSTLINGVPPFLAARESRSIRAGIGVGAGIAAIDATIGWAVTWAIGPGAPKDIEGMAPHLLAGLLALTVLLVVVFGAIIGLVAGMVAVRTARPAVS